ncbi:hypothetical protein CAPN002_23910 [Capnocytophaga stomatis]|nr:hypothetical protein CAPN002_23910 [Capnocytophaga stomatis]
MSFLKKHDEKTKSNVAYHTGRKCFFSPEYYQIMTHQNVKYLKINCYSVIEVENVDEVYKELKNKNIPIEIELRNEP